MGITDEELMHALADAARQAILPHFRAGGEVSNKDASGFDPVTEADQAAERSIRAILAEERPDDAVHGEEFADREGDSGRTWIVDPIDGTRAFMMGLPTWGVLIALSDRARITHGLMDQPFVGERFHAATARARYARSGEERALRTRRTPEGLASAIIATTSPDLFEVGDERRFRALAERTRMVRYGTDCYGYALLAAGHLDVVAETGLKAVDIAPFVALVEAAGGVLADWSGRPIGPTLLNGYNGEALAVADPALLDPVLEVLGR